MLYGLVVILLTATVFASVAINRVQRLQTHLLATGDDDGVVKVRVLLGHILGILLMPLQL